METHGEILQAIRRDLRFQSDSKRVNAENIARHSERLDHMDERLGQLTALGEKMRDSLAGAVLDIELLKKSVVTMEGYLTTALAQKSEQDKLRVEVDGIQKGIAKAGTEKTVMIQSKTMIFAAVLSFLAVLLAKLLELLTAAWKAKPGP